MPNLSHLNALRVRLDRERARLAGATKIQEIEMRKVWIAGIEKEIADEMNFLGGKITTEFSNLTDDELLTMLGHDDDDVSN